MAAISKRQTVAPANRHGHDWPVHQAFSRIHSIKLRTLGTSAICSG